MGLYCDCFGFGVIVEVMGGLCYLIGELGCMLVCVGILFGDLLLVLYGVIGVLFVLCYCE